MGKEGKNEEIRKNGKKKEKLREREKKLKGKKKGN